MEPLEVDPTDPPHTGSPSDPRQAQLVARLVLIGPGPARFFQDACRIMSGDVVLGAATHTVAHYLREIDRAIRKALEPMVERRRRVEIEAMRKGRQEAWIAEMVDVLGFADPGAVAARWSGVAGQLHELAHRDALAQPRPMDDTFRSLWNEAQEIYGLLLRQFASSFLATMPLIDKLARKSPGKKTFSLRSSANTPAGPRIFY